MTLRSSVFALSASIASVATVATLATLATLATTGTLAAQTTVVTPAQWTDVEAPSGNAFPFGSSTQQFRYLNVHDDMAGPPRFVLAFALRRSGTTSTTVTSPITVVMDGFMSTATTTGATVDATFDNNHGTDKAQVLSARTISFPPAPTGLLPYPFLHHVPLDVPFSYAGAGPLCWEVQITSRPAAASIFHDYVAGTSANPGMVVSRFGTGCIATGRTVPFALTGASSVSWPSGTGTISATASDGPQNAAAIYLVGTSTTSFSGIPLPFALPGTAGGASGACFVHTNALGTLGGTLSSTGGFTFRLPVPLQLRFAGLDVFGQAAALDAAANPFGLVTSNGVDHHVVPPYGAQPGGRVYRSSLAATGTAGPGQTLVVQFTTS